MLSDRIHRTQKKKTKTKEEKKREQPTQQQTTENLVTCVWSFVWRAAWTHKAIHLLFIFTFSTHRQITIIIAAQRWRQQQPRGWPKFQTRFIETHDVNRACSTSKLHPIFTDQLLFLCYLLLNYYYLFIYLFGCSTSGALYSRRQ